MSREFHTLDVFTKRRFAGNPLAVVTNSEGLDEEAMQTVAREFNLSETVFVLPPENPAHNAKIRIFTPARELDFAGHPTVGTAVLLALKKFDAGEADREDDAIIVLEENVGPVRVGVRLRSGAAPFAEFDAPKLPFEIGEAASKEAFAAALGIGAEDIGFENHVPTIYSAGNPFTFVPLRDLETVSRARIVREHWEAAFGTGHASACFMYTRETVNHDAAFHARMFAPALGVDEDPATGSAAAAFAGIVMRFDKPLAGRFRAVIEQGYEMERPSEMMVEMDVGDDGITGVRIGGHAVTVMRGELED